MKKVLKWVGISLAGLAILLLLTGFFLVYKGKNAANQTHEVTASLLSETPTDSLSLARGEHLSLIHGCLECHGDGYAGKTMIDAPPFVVSSANLTSGKGGIGSSYTTQDWDRAIRYGVKPDGRGLIIMPSKTFHNLTDDDAASLIAYLKTIPPVDNELPATELRTLGSILAGVGAFDPAMEVITSSQRSEIDTTASVEAKGEYLSSITCIYCHGADLRGGPAMDPSMPAPPDLKPAGEWSFDIFEKAMRTGVSPSNPAINSEAMPWQSFKHMSDDELRAIHAYLKTVDA